MHVIRLRSAWRELDGRWVRRFNKPTGLEGGDRVWLAWDGEVEGAELNGEPLAAPSCRHEVTENLRAANELRFPAETASVRGSVRLEIAPDTRQNG